MVSSRHDALMRQGEDLDAEGLERAGDVEAVVVAAVVDVENLGGGDGLGEDRVQAGAEEWALVAGGDDHADRGQACRQPGLTVLGLFGILLCLGGRLIGDVSIPILNVLNLFEEARIFERAVGGCVLAENPISREGYSFLDLRVFGHDRFVVLGHDLEEVGEGVGLGGCGAVVMFLGHFWALPFFSLLTEEFESPSAWMVGDRADRGATVGEYVRSTTTAATLERGFRSGGF